ncbi:cupin domain-containing protein [Sphingobacteriales bacterium UPWRP_1]|nr:hypothetical protein B6N25_03110 [Sphingobacteriales bacterium TSM_CSS]PSJ73636.1 cupin domain-containing protein [Sphingobacteriales bacterium UPWRP_1]
MEITNSAHNLFMFPDELPGSQQPELFEPLLKGKNILIERIISNGQQTPPDFWYEQQTDEWVMLLSGKATLLFDHDEGQTLEMNTGEWVFIPALRRHRVVFTSQQPPCIWLAVHGNF